MSIYMHQCLCHTCIICKPSYQHIATRTLSVKRNYPNTEYHVHVGLRTNKLQGNLSMTDMCRAHGVRIQGAKHIIQH